MFETIVKIVFFKYSIITVLELGVDIIELNWGMNTNNQIGLFEKSLLSYFMCIILINEPNVIIYTNLHCYFQYLLKVNHKITLESAFCMVYVPPLQNY